MTHQDGYVLYRSTVNTRLIAEKVAKPIFKDQCKWMKIPEIRNVDFWPVDGRTYEIEIVDVAN